MRESVAIFGALILESSCEDIVGRSRWSVRSHLIAISAGSIASFNDSWILFALLRIRLLSAGLGGAIFSKRHHCRTHAHRAAPLSGSVTVAPVS